jgi:alpha-L-fucosidase
MNRFQQWIARIDEVIAGGPFSADWESLKSYRIPSWYEDAKFGIFIHWGVYCVPAFGNEWYPRHMYERGKPEFEHHLKTYGSQAKFGYKDFIPLFKAEAFDAGAWAELFRRAGARFVMPVAEHHDGFAMYDSELTRWCAAKMGPGRDVIGEIAVAVRREGLVFAASSHRAEHWWFFDEGRKIESDVNDPAFLDFYGPAQPHPPEHNLVDTPERPDEAYLRDWLVRTCELVEKYQPQIVWFDWWIRHVVFKPYLQKFAAFYYNLAAQWGKGVAINYKFEAFAEGTAVLDIERGQLAGIRPLLWQNDTSVSKNSWGYIHDQDYKTVTSIVHDLIDVVSKNGALLLNIGPKADGTIPVPEQEMLLEIGRWLCVNGEGIYGSRPWKVFGEGPTQVVEGSFTDTKRAAFTHEDIRFTAKGDVIYAFVLNRPADGRTVIRSLGGVRGLFLGKIADVSVLGTDYHPTFSLDHDGLRVQLPEGLVYQHAIGLKISTGR